MFVLCRIICHRYTCSNQNKYHIRYFFLICQWNKCTKTQIVQKVKLSTWWTLIKFLPPRVRVVRVFRSRSLQVPTTPNWRWLCLPGDIVHTTYCTLHTTHCSMHTTLWTVLTTHLTLQTAHCPLHSLHWKLKTSHWKLNTAH